jgi:N-acetyl-gamma-glutamyl-phosphate reductase
VTRVHVLGASGYAAGEAIRLLHVHPLLEIGVLESRTHPGLLLADHFPLLRTTEYRFSPAGSVVESARAGDVVLAAGDAGQARDLVAALVAGGVRVIDLSSDFRLDGAAAYGLTEWYRATIASAPLVANPGCYPTAALLALLPLVGVADPVHVAVDAKSAISGAGRKPSVAALFAEVSGEVRAYGLQGHRHQPEIERYLRRAGAQTVLTFTPHVVPLARGMLVDVYAFFDCELDADEVDAAYARAYAASSFVRVLARERTPSVAAVSGTNDAELRIDTNGRVVRAICAIDNLGKGAAGQAVQNLNVMLGYPEETGFHARAVVA